jgi:hypothetical protein
MDPVQGSPDGTSQWEAGAHLSIGIGAKAGYRDKQRIRSLRGLYCA